MICRNDEPRCHDEHQQPDAPPTWAHLGSYPDTGSWNRRLGESLVCLGLWKANTDRSLKAYTMRRGRGRLIVAGVVESELRAERTAHCEEEVADGTQ